MVNNAGWNVSEKVPGEISLGIEVHKEDFLAFGGQNSPD